MNANVQGSQNLSPYTAWGWIHLGIAALLMLAAISLIAPTPGIGVLR